MARLKMGLGRAARLARIEARLEKAIQGARPAAHAPARPAARAARTASEMKLPIAVLVLGVVASVVAVAMHRSADAAFNGVLVGFFGAVVLHEVLSDGRKS